MDTRRTRRGPHTRQLILDASLRLFSSRGFARTTVRDIAREAGITDAAIYYHFDSKRDVLEALAEERGFLTRLENLQRVDSDLAPVEMVMWMTAGAVSLMDDNRDFLRLIIMEGLGGEEAALGQYNRLLDLWESALSTVFERYEAKGKLRGGVAQSLARQVIYTILMAFQESLLGRQGLTGLTSEDRQQALRSFLAPCLVRLMAGSGGAHES